ncbi:hypothetical protein LG943_08045 [Streptomonospora sp. S1-112]|uniref:Uncharacterized protein n=1 Tax=Streptomonospora mangrovi TaxID=2883123 RepID=A0A9X3NUE2_9ACTN|nr:hypothetical protein [Streptomonospora mangrovi]MDA0564276.1 hypothetical protein [Streptomonospora mangrovi]
MSVPGGFAPGGLPVGRQIAGPRLAERRVPEVGHASVLATGSGRRRLPLGGRGAAANGQDGT